MTTRTSAARAAVVTDDAATETQRAYAGSWLELAAAVPHPPAPRSALACNRELGGFAKFALSPGASRVHVRAEVPTDVEPELVRRLADTEAGIASAAGAGGRRPAEPDGGSPCEVVLERIVELADDAGWPRVATRTDGVVVDLGLGDRGARALVERGRAMGVVRAAVALATFPTSTPDPCGAALAVFLLRAAAAVRLARPVLVERGPWATVAYEVVYATTPDPAELAHALAALRVAAALTSAEVGVLARDATVARAYLARAGSTTNTTASFG